MADGVPRGDETREQRWLRGEEVVRSLNRGQPQPVFEALRREFPLLAEGIATYALGDVWAGTTLDDRTRQIATVCAFASLGMQELVKVHAGYALNVGVTEGELKDVVSLVTVTGGFGRAVQAASTLAALFQEQRSAAE